MALRVLRPDHDVHQLAEDGKAVEGEPDRAVPLAGHDPEPASLLPEHRQEVEHAVERLQRLVQRLVVQAVRLHEVVHAVGVELPHLGDEARAADRGADHLLVRLPPEDGT